MALRNAFKLYVSINDQLDIDNTLMKEYMGYPIDNVIQIKLSEASFKSLFKDPGMLTTEPVSPGMRYNAVGLIGRLSSFFSRNGQFNNYNNLASDITILVNNTFNDVDVNAVTLESACTTDGTIFDYFLKSEAQWGGDPVSLAGETTSEYGTSGETNCLVYEMIAREIDNMISRNVESTSEDMGTSGLLQPDGSYDALDAQYTIANDAFWNELQEGDSIFIEGSFLVPTKKGVPEYKSIDRMGVETTYTPVGTGNLPVILQFVNSQSNSYAFTQS